jgi:hypothetical protein
MIEQCAVGANGQLLDASDIVFFNDPDDTTPLPPVPSTEDSVIAGQGTHITPHTQA